MIIGPIYWLHCRPKPKQMPTQFTIVDLLKLTALTAVAFGAGAILQFPWYATSIIFGPLCLLAVIWKFLPTPIRVLAAVTYFTFWAWILLPDVQ